MKNWTVAKNILCICLDTMDNLLMTVPAVKTLKEALPDRRLTLLTGREGAGMAQAVAPFFDEILTYPAPWLKECDKREDPGIDFAMINRLHEGGHDGAVIFTLHGQSPFPSAFLCYLAGIPLRAAYCRENPCSLLTDWLMEEELYGRARHEVRRHFDLVTHLGATTDCSATASLIMGLIRPE